MDDGPLITKLVLERRCHTATRCCSKLQSLIKYDLTLYDGHFCLVHMLLFFFYFLLQLQLLKYINTIIVYVEI